MTTPVKNDGVTPSITQFSTNVPDNQGNLHVTSSVDNSRIYSGSFSGSYVGDGSGLTGITAGSTADRVVFTTTNGELTTEAGFTYDATTNRLTVPNLTTTTFTASFITSSQIHTSGSNIFGDDTTDTQTLIGTTKMTGSAQITGSLYLGDTAAGSGLFIATHNGYEVKYQGTSETNILSVSYTHLTMPTICSV